MGGGRVCWGHDGRLRLALITPSPRSPLMSLFDVQLHLFVRLVKLAGLPSGLQLADHLLDAMDFVGTSQHPESGARTEHFKLFAPRVGLAYRLNDKTVIRTGGGVYYLPSTLWFSEAPWARSLTGSAFTMIARCCPWSTGRWSARPR